MKNLLVAFCLISASTSAFANDKIVIGKDERYAISDKNKTKVHTSIGLLVLYGKDGSSASCTGTLISKRHVLTAAHCLLDQQGNSFTPYFLPGVNQDLTKKRVNPYGMYKGVRQAVYPPYYNSAEPAHDVGIIELDSDLPYEPLVIAQYQANIDKELISTGYPGDKTFGTQWESRGTSHRLLKNAHNLDTYSGQSGSAIRNKTNKVVGVHSSGVKFIIAKWNEFATFDSNIINFLKAEMK